MMNLIILRGYPGSGKTTLGKALQDRGLGTFIDHNEILNYLCSIVGSDKGIYDKIHQLELGMARQILQSGKTAIVARGFSTKESVQPYVDMAKEAGADIKIVRLDVAQDVLEERVTQKNRQKDAISIKDPQELRKYIDDHPFESWPGEVELDANKDVTSLVNAVTDNNG